MSARCRFAGESGIADVAVSNGRLVARTDAGGAYRLPVQRGQTVFIVKPAGWRAALHAPRAIVLRGREVLGGRVVR